MAQLGLSTRKSVLALVKESVEGTPLAPSSGSDYTAIQDDLEMSPSFEELENAELQGSIGAGKTILGSENPEASFSHYLRHSGVVGQAPDFGDLFEGAFGDVDAAGVEYNTVAASTVSQVKVDAGEGVNFQRGQALLSQDGVNGFSIRNVLSVSGDNLTPAFNLPGAPALGVNLGRAVLYKPADDTHPALTVWNYIANGGNRQMMAGARVTELGINFEAGQLINASFSMAGIAFYWNPIEVTSSTRYLDFNDGGDQVAVVTAKFYKDPHELASALQTAMNSVSSGFTVVYSDTTGKFTFTKASGTFELLWDTGANAANSIGPVLGFSVVADDTGVLTYTSDNALTLAAPHTPSYDTAQPLVAKANEVLLGDATDTACFGAQTVSMTLSNERVVIPDICEVSGQAGAAFTGRSVEIQVRALLKQYDAGKFKRFREGTKTQFAYNAGEKSGGNWVPGKCVNIFSPTCTITSFQVSDADGLAVLDMTLRTYVENGLGEIYANFV
jgi:hypothetical protein